MKVDIHTMEGLLSGKCLPANMLVNESLSAYLVRQFEALHDRAEAAERERDELKDKLNSIKSTYCHVDTAKNAFIPGCLDAWGRPVPQYLPYDFSGNPGASATQYCNGWNDSGGYWLKHVGYLQQKLSDAEEELARRDAAAGELPSDELSRLREWVKCVEAERDKAISWHSSLLKKHDKLQADIARRDAVSFEMKVHYSGIGKSGPWVKLNDQRAYEKLKLRHSGDADYEFRELHTAAPPAVLPPKHADELKDRAELIEAYSKTQCEIAQELGCDSDNESILKAIYELKALGVQPQKPVVLPEPHAHLIWIQAGRGPDDYWDDVEVSGSEEDRCCDGSERYAVYSEFEVKAMLDAGNVKWEVKS